MWMKKKVEIGFEGIPNREFAEVLLQCVFNGQYVHEKKNPQQCDEFWERRAEPSLKGHEWYD